jgi:hypothetical protein
MNGWLFGLIVLPGNGAEKPTPSVAFRRRTAMVFFLIVPSVLGIIYSIFQKFNLEWKLALSTFLPKRLDSIFFGTCLN